MGDGDFLETETFRGRISQLNLWKQVLQPHQVADVAKPCVREHSGVLKSWADIKRGLVGTLSESSPSELKGSAAVTCPGKNSFLCITEDHARIVETCFKKLTIVVCFLKILFCCF